MSNNPKFEDCPQDIKNEIIKLECARLGFGADEVDVCCLDNAIWGYVRGFMSESPGFAGDVVYIIWPIAPDACTIYGRYAHQAEWKLLQQTSW